MGFPTSIPSFTTKSAGQTIQPGHINDHQAETVAIATQLLTWTTYVPVWGNTGTANTLGNASISGSYTQSGKTVKGRLYFVFGTTSVSGNGVWTFTLPVTMASGVIVVGNNTDAIGSGLLLDSSAGRYGAIVIAATTSTVVLMNTDVITTGVTGSVPFAWVSTDALSCTFEYQAA